MLKRSLLSLLTLVCWASFAFAAEVELNMTGTNLDTHPAYVKSMLPFNKRVEELSNNRIKITYFNPGTICPEAEVLNSLNRGILHIGQTPIARYPNKFIVASAVELPFVFTNARAAAATTNKLIQTLPEFAKEFEEYKFLRSGTSTLADILTTKPVRTIDDLKGKKIGCVTPSGAEIIKLLGATPVMMNVVDMYMNLQRGMVDGVFMPIPTYKSLKVAEVAKYLTRCSIGTGFVPTLMSKSSYEALPEEDKKIFDTLFGMPASFFAGIVVDTSTQEDLDFIVANLGVEVIELSPEEKARWAEAVAPYISSWKEKVAKKGVDPDKVLKEMYKWAEYYNNMDNFNTEYNEIKGALGSSLVAPSL